MNQNISFSKDDFLRFESSAGPFAYAPEEMQLYCIHNTEPDWTRPLLSRSYCRSPISNYAKATISVVTGCNLGCDYCVFGQLSANETRFMLPETGRAIVDYLCNAFGSDIERITLSFTSNGEPSLNLGTIEAIKTYCREKTATGGPEFRFNFATNAMPLSLETIERYLSEEDQAIFFSIDGPPRLHNCLRVTRSGKGSYDESLQKIAFYRERYEKYDKGFSSSTVLTAEDESFDEILLHLDALNLEYIVMRPIRGIKHSALGLNQTTLPIFQRGYARMIDLLEDKALAGELDLLYKVCNRYDFFGRLLSALLLGEERVQGCPGCPPKHSDIARYSLVFDIDGQVYFPCRDFIGRKEFSLGSVFSEVDLHRVRDVMEQVRSNRRPMCQACWARSMCGGGCYNAALAATGTLEEPDEDLCKLISYLAERAIRLAYLLCQRQPQALSSLIERALEVSPWIEQENLR